MKTASELRARMIVRVEGTPYRVIAADYHGGGGKMGGVTHAKLQSLETGAPREWRFRGDEPLDEAVLERQHLQFLYSDDRLSHFMDPGTFEQFELDGERLGPARAYLAENATYPVEFLDGVPIGVLFPDIVDARVARTAAPVHTQGTDNVWKDAILENGVRVKVPPFIAEGELIRVNVDAATYVERSKRR